MALDSRTETKKVNVEFSYVSFFLRLLYTDMVPSGGLEILFSNRRSYQIKIPNHQSNGNPTNINDLVQYLCDHLMTDHRKELFMASGTV